MSDLLSSMTTPRARSGGPVLASIAIGTAAVLIAGVGTAVAIGSAIGGGQQPEDVLPSSAVGVVKIDLDPSLGQRKAIYDLSKKVKSLHTTGEKSIRDDLLSSVFDDSSENLDYTRDIKPWLGDRAAVAAIPNDSPEGFGGLVALQYTDKEKARTALLKEDDAFAFSGDYVILADTRREAEDAAKSKKHLSDNAKFGDAVDALGDDQLILGWADLERVYNAIPKAQLDESPFAKLKSPPSGSLVVGAHADSHYLEIRGKAVDVGDSLKQYGGTTLGSSKGHNLIAGFPTDTAAAFEATGLGESLSKAYSELSKDDAFFDDVEQTAKDMGFDLPEDFPSVFGTDFALAAFGDLKDTPSLVAHVKAAKPERAQALLKGLQPTEDGPAVAFATEDGGFFLGTDDAAIAAARKGGLGDTPAFRRALPDVKTAGFALYLDIAKVTELSGDVLPEEAKDLEAVGVTADAAGGEFRIRLTVR